MNLILWGLMADQEPIITKGNLNLSYKEELPGGPQYAAAAVAYPVQQAQQDAPNGKVKTMPGVPRLSIMNL